jgi:hypothetical protein
MQDIHFLEITSLFEDIYGPKKKSDAVRGLTLTESADRHATSATANNPNITLLYMCIYTRVAQHLALIWHQTGLQVRFYNFCLISKMFNISRFRGNHEPAT